MRKYFSQKDAKWAKEQLGTCKNETIARSGCKITTYANCANGYTPSDVNKLFIKKGGYVNGCMTVDSIDLPLLGLQYLGKQKTPPKERAIADTDHYKSKGVPQHFFLWKPDGSIIDPLDLNPAWKKNPYKIVSYRLFRAVEEPKEKSDTKVPLSPENAPNDEITTVESIPQEVEVVNNQPQEQIMQIQNSFDKVTLIKIGKGALIAGGGALAIYFLQAVMQMDFGTATPLIVALASIAINAIKEYKAGV